MGPEAIQKALVVLAAVATTVLVGCGSSDPDPTAVVPGGAVAIAPQGTPDFCAEMTKSEALTGLGATFAKLAEPSPPSDGVRAGLERAATALAQLAPIRRALHRHFTATARALRRLAAHPRAPGATAQVAAALHTLGKRLQGPCRFPRG